MPLWFPVFQAMCGTFAGMSTHVIIPSAAWAMVLALVTLVLYELEVSWLKLGDGLGGR
jgi:hypothetical protein